MNNKKVLGIIAGVVVVIVILLACFVGGDKDTSKKSTAKELSNDPDVILANAQQESSAVKEEDKKEFEQIDVTKYLEYYSGSEGKLVLLARPTCSYCMIATPIIQSIMKEYNIEVSYLNTDNFTSDDQTAFVKSNEEFSTGFGTPMLLLVKENQIVDKIDGMTDSAHYIEFFQKNGYIK